MKGIFKLLNNNRIKGHNIKWIGLGCIKGEIGEEWEPQIKILPRNDSLQEEKNNLYNKITALENQDKLSKFTVGECYLDTR